MAEGGVQLVAMRLSEMTRVHPRQDNSRVCVRCGAGVGIYPSGQAALRHNPGIEVICVPCAVGSPLPGDAEVRPAATLEELRQESRESVAREASKL